MGKDTHRHGSAVARNTEAKPQVHMGASAPVRMQASGAGDRRLSVAFEEHVQSFGHEGGL
jgi:hypothetical protein